MTSEQELDLELLITETHKQQETNKEIETKLYKEYKILSDLCDKVIEKVKKRKEKEKADPIYKTNTL